MTPIHAIPIKSSVFVDSILTAVIPGPNDDSKSLFGITLFYALVHNKGINSLLLEAFSLKKCEVCLSIEICVIIIYRDTHNVQRYS